MKDKYSAQIKDLSDNELLFHVYTTQILLFLISFILGIFLFDHYSDFFDLFKWNDPSIVTIGGLAGLIIVLFDIIFMKLLPRSYYDDGGLNERIFQTRSIFSVFMISAVVSLGEELLFRGVIQTHVGLWISSLLFSLVHIRYLFNWFLFINVTVLSFVIGLIYEVTDNLVVTIFMHFLIDFSLGCIIKFRYIKKQKEQEGIFNE
jgi:uncharacterized protein